MARGAGKRSRLQDLAKPAGWVVVLLLLTATVASGAWLDRSRELAPAESLPVSSPPTVAHRVPSALFVGDSYTAGTGAADSHHGYACLAAQAMGWHCNLDAEGGTGYLNDGASNSDKFVPFIDRLSSDKARFLADLIVVDGGRNDGRYPVDQVLAAADTYLHELRSLWPRAQIVVMSAGYLWNTPDNDLFGVELATGLAPLVKEVGGHLVDPLQERWVSPDQVTGFLWTDNIHPNAEGHRYLAQRLTASLRQLGLSSLSITDPQRTTVPDSAGTVRASTGQG